MTSSIDRDLRLLRSDHGSPCLSLTLGLASARSAAHADKMKFKNALRAIDRSLATLGMGTRKREEFLQPLRDFSERILLPHSGRSVAVFRSPTVWKTFFVEEVLDDGWHLAETFDLHHVQPLTADGTVYLVAISKNSARVFVVDCIKGDAKEMKIRGMPKSLQEAWRGKEHQGKNLQFHTLGRGGAAQFHGQASAKDETKKETQIYIQKVARAVEAHLKRATDPLVFAGVTALFGMYSAVNRYPYFLHACLKGNPDELSGKQLAKEVKQLFA